MPRQASFSNHHRYASASDVPIRLSPQLQLFARRGDARIRKTHRTVAILATHRDPLPIRMAKLHRRRKTL